MKLYQATTSQDVEKVKRQHMITAHPEADDGAFIDCTLCRAIEVKLRRLRQEEKQKEATKP